MASSVTQVNTSWATPRNWSTGELATAALLNAHLRDELLALKTPAHGYSVIDEASNYSTSSTSFVDVDATDLAITITTGGGLILCGFVGVIAAGVTTSSDRWMMDVAVDGTRFIGDDGLIGSSPMTAATFSFVIPISGLSAGSHTFKLQWKLTSGTLTLYAGAGTGSNDFHPRFWVKEM